MKGKKTARALQCLLMLAITVGLAFLSGGLVGYIRADARAVPPGVRVAKRQLITVWLAGDLPGAAAWLRRQAAAYSRQQPGVSVWLRTVSQADIEAMADAPPDLLVFTAETPIPPDQVRQPVALCLSGYALAARTRQAAVTPAPRSLFGVTPSPIPQSAPTPQVEGWPPAILAEEGFGALALGVIGAPAGAALLSANDVQRRFLTEEDAAALLNARQARVAAAQGVAFRVIAAVPATDLVLYGAPAIRADAAAEAFLQYLMEDTAQRALAEEGLLSARADICLYGADRPFMQALEAALGDGWRAPPFLWAAEKRDILLTAQALYAAGQGTAGLLR